MDIELIEIKEFLAHQPPFDQLPDATLARLPRLLTVRYFRRGTPFPPADETDQPCVYVLRRGAVELRNEHGDLVTKLAEGDLCDMRCRQRAAAESATGEPGCTNLPAADLGTAPDSLTLIGNTAEDTLVYELPCQELDRLRAENPSFAEHFDLSVARRLHKALAVITEPPGTGATLMTVRVRDLLRHPPTSVPVDTSIRTAAQLMAERRHSSLLVMDGERLAGIITDRDLRTRVVAAGLSTDRPVRDIMTANLSTIGPDALGFEALIQMTRLHVHHLPVVEDGRAIGMLSTTDLTRFQSANAVYLVSDIRRAGSVQELAAISRKLPELQVQLVASGATASNIGQAITAITDAFTRKLIEMAEAEFGPPPVPYAWVVGGSQARREQSSHSDQDNAMLIADHMAPEDDAWFGRLANFVNDGLNACGYVYCPGGVMAKNPQWRQPLRIWTKYFNTWIRRPDPMALMLSSVFFDLRALHDPEGLYGELNERVLALSKTNRIYIAYMAANALKHRPPLGFFRNFVLISGGDHDRTVDIKHRGTVPIIDLARVYALSLGLNEINTIERLKASAETEALSRQGAASLVDAFELVGTLRMRHQAHQLRRGQPADNFLNPEQLSALERGHLKDAFVLINTMQETLGQRYQTGRFA